MSFDTNQINARHSSLFKVRSRVNFNSPHKLLFHSKHSAIIRLGMLILRGIAVLSFWVAVRVAVVVRGMVVVLPGIALLLDRVAVRAADVFRAMVVVLPGIALLQDRVAVREAAAIRGMVVVQRDAVVVRVWVVVYDMVRLLSGGMQLLSGGMRLLSGVWLMSGMQLLPGIRLLTSRRKGLIRRRRKALSRLLNGHNVCACALQVPCNNNSSLSM